MDIPFSSRSVVYTLSAGQTGPLDFPFPLKDAADVKVVRRRGGGDTTLVLNTDYTLALSGTPAGATGAAATLVAGAAAGDKLILEGLRTPASTTGFTPTGPFTSTNVNDALEKLWIVCQELRRDVDRAVRRHPTDTSSESLLLPLDRDVGLGLDADGGLVPFEGGGGGGGGGFPDLPLAVENGGTGADDAAEARTNLGLGALADLDAVGPEFSTAGDTLRFAGILPDQGRLSLTTGTPVTDADVTGVTNAFYTPYTGNLLSLWDGTAWRTTAFAEIPVYVTSLRPSTSNSTNVLTVDDTSSLIVGMEVSGGSVLPGTTVTSIVDATTVHLSQAIPATSSATRTFRIPANSNVDVFALLIGGAVNIRLGPLWTNGQTRATGITLTDGVWTMTGDKTRRLIGTLRTPSVAGVLADTARQRFVSNLANPVRRSLRVLEAASSWGYAVNAWRQVNANAANQVEICNTVPRTVSIAALMVASVSNVNAPFATGVGVDTAIADSSQLRGLGASQVTSIPVQCQSFYEGSPGLGFHYLAWLERTFGGLTYTIFGTGSAAGLQPFTQTGLVGAIDA